MIHLTPILDLRQYEFCVKLKDKTNISLGEYLLTLQNTNNILKIFLSDLQNGEGIVIFKFSLL